MDVNHIVVRIGDVILVNGRIVKVEHRAEYDGMYWCRVVDSEDPDDINTTCGYYFKYDDFRHVPPEADLKTYRLLYAKTDPRIGKIYRRSIAYLGKPNLIKVYAIYYDPYDEHTVYKAIDNHGHVTSDRVVYLNYFSEATPEEILLYWYENEKKTP